MVAIGPAEIAKYTEKRRGECAANGTINRELAIRMLRLAYENGNLVVTIAHTPRRASAMRRATRRLQEGVGDGLQERRSLLNALTAFVAGHRRCGELDGGRDNAYIWLQCSCGWLIHFRYQTGTLRSSC